jgi:hypothetical protein
MRPHPCRGGRLRDVVTALLPDAACRAPRLWVGGCCDALCKGSAKVCPDRLDAIDRTDPLLIPIKNATCQCLAIGGRRCARIEFGLGATPRRGHAFHRTTRFPLNALAAPRFSTTLVTVVQTAD